MFKGKDGRTYYTPVTSKEISAGFNLQFCVSARTLICLTSGFIPSASILAYQGSVPNELTLLHS